MNPVKLGIIGCGVIGTFHLSTASKSPLIDVVAIADQIEDKVKESAEQFNVKKTYSEGIDLINDPDIEAIVLAFPTANRIKLALQAFAKGKHVLTEKPVAMNADEVKQMIKARGDLVSGCCSSRYRFLEGAKVVTDFIGSGALGTLRTVRCRAIGAAGELPDAPRPEWRLKKALNGGGILVNWGCYDMDYLLGITGWKLKPLKVFAQTWTIPPQFESHIAPGSDAETFYTAMILCEGGTVIQVERGEYMPAHTEDAWQIIGTKGSLRLTMITTDPKKIIHDDTTTEKGVISRVLWEGNEDSAMVHAGPVTDFAQAIREKRQPKTSLENALVVQQITDAIYKSAKTGSVVEV
jgi:UDP-N-acetyl-2-amino-2-deoxyglucuronate dehydrogenase